MNALLWTALRCNILKAHRGGGHRRQSLTKMGSTSDVSACSPSVEREIWNPCWIPRARNNERFRTSRKYLQMGCAKISPQKRTVLPYDKADIIRRRTSYWSPWAVQCRTKEASECIMRWIRNAYARMGTRYVEQASLFVWCDYSGKG